MPDASELDQLTAITVGVVKVESNTLEATHEGETIETPVMVISLLVMDGNEPGPRTPQILHVTLDDEQAADVVGQVLEILIEESNPEPKLTNEQIQELDASIREALENGEM